MKKLSLIVLTLLAALSIAAPVNAADNQPLKTQLLDCFSRHGQLMDKSANKNVEICWRQHHRLMR